jgi:hypothetical protein
VYLVPVRDLQAIGTVVESHIRARAVWAGAQLGRLAPSRVDRTEAGMTHTLPVPHHGHDGLESVGHGLG